MGPTEQLQETLVRYFQECKVDISKGTERYKCPICIESDDAEAANEETQETEADAEVGSENTQFE